MEVRLDLWHLGFPLYILLLQKTASGIFLPQSSVAPPPEATVLAVGPGARDRDGKLIEVSVKAGDRVLLPTFGGQSFKVGEEVR